MRVPLQVREQGKKPRRASPAATPPGRRGLELGVVRVGPLSVFRMWMVLASLLLVALLVAVVILYAVLGGMGVLASIERALNRGGIGHHFAFSLGWILARVAQIGAAMVVVSSALAACVTAVFNAIAELLGGVEISVVARSPGQTAADTADGHRRSRTAA